MVRGNPRTCNNGVRPEFNPGYNQAMVAGTGGVATMGMATMLIEEVATTIMVTHHRSFGPHYQNSEPLLGQSEWGVS